MTKRSFVPALILAVFATIAPPAPAQEREQPVTAQEPRGAALVERLRKGGLVMFFRHADTRGMPSPVIMVLGQIVGGKAFPEGAALVLEPGQNGPRVLGILMLAPIAGGGFHNC